MFGDAESYERFMGRWSRLVAPLLVKFTDVQDSERVLDVGSGTGSLAYMIAEQGARSHVLGVDPCREYVEYANRRSPFSDRVSFQIGDAQQLGFPGATFQTSLSLLVFNFIPDPQRAFGEVRRVTKPGGRISAAILDYGSGMQMLRIFWDTAVSVDPTAEKFDEKHMPLCQLGELAQLWKQRGLENVRERPLDISMRFESFADYWDAFILGQGPAGAYARSLDGNRLRAVRDEVECRLPEAAHAVPFSLRARAWAVRGTVPGAP